MVLPQRTIWPMVTEVPFVYAQAIWQGLCITLGNRPHESKSCSVVSCFQLIWCHGNVLIQPLLFPCITESVFLLQSPLSSITSFRPHIFFHIYVFHVCPHIHMLPPHDFFSLLYHQMCLVIVYIVLGCWEYTTLQKRMQINTVRNSNLKEKGTQCEIAGFGLLSSELHPACNTHSGGIIHSLEKLSCRVLIKLIF